MRPADRLTGFLAISLTLGHMTLAQAASGLPAAVQQTARKLRDMSREEFLRQDPAEIENFVRRSDLHPDVDADELVRMIRDEEITIEQVLEALNDANANLFNRPIVGAQVWRSDDRGDSWRLTHEEPIRQMVFTYGYYFGQIRVSPADADQVDDVVAQFGLEAAEPGRRGHKADMHVGPRRLRGRLGQEVEHITILGLESREMCRIGSKISQEEHGHGQLARLLEELEDEQALVILSCLP